MGTNAEWVKNSEGKRIYPISHSSVIIRNKSTVDKDLTALEGKAEKFEEDIETIEQAIKGNAWVILGKATYGGELVIPAVGWVEENGLYILEIENAQITESTMPIVAVSPDSYAIALSCGLKSYCRSYSGKMKIYADTPPTVELIASISLIGENTTVGKGLQVNPISGAMSVDSNVVVTNDDLVDEDELNNDIKNMLNS